jgi:hypothetical protein
MNSRGRKHIQKVLDKNPPCYVLITCEEPSEDGQMQVEMTYEGDAVLASYLLQGAQNVIDQEEEQQFDLAPVKRSGLVK